MSSFSRCAIIEILKTIGISIRQGRDLPLSPLLYETLMIIIVFAVVVVVVVVVVDQHHECASTLGMVG